MARSVICCCKSGHNFFLLYLSLVIMRSPWTSKPLKSCGAMPLKRPRTPSCSIMNLITSPKLLNGLPFRAGGGLDCRPTLATINGWVARVAKALDVAPKTVVVSELNQDSRSKT